MPPHGSRGMAAALVCACTAAGPVAAAGTAPPRTVVFGEEGTPTCLNTLLSACGGLPAARITGQGLTQQNLLTVDGQGRYVAQLAARIPSGADIRFTGTGMSTTFHLRPTARWSDGVALTAADVVFTWHTIVNPDNAVASRAGWDRIARIVPAPGDPTTFRVDWRVRYAPWKETFSLSGGSFILPRHILRGRDFTTVWTGTGLDGRVPFVAPGPYVLRRYRRDQGATLVASARFWGAGRRPRIIRIVDVFGLGADGAESGLARHTLDLVAPAFDVPALTRLRRMSGVVVLTTPAMAWEHLVINTRRPPLRDVRVRRALAYAIDRPAVLRRVLKGGAAPLDSFLAPGEPGYVPAWSVYRYRPARARRLLRAAGWTRGRDGIFTKAGERLSLAISIAPGSALRRASIALWAARARAAGIELHVKEDPDLVTTSLPSGGFQIAEVAFLSGVDPSPADILGGDRIPTAVNGYSGQDFSRYSGVSRLVAQSDVAYADASLPPGGPSVDAARSRLLVRIQRRAARDVPFIPLYRPPNTLARRADLGGPSPNPTRLDVFWNAGEWAFHAGPAVSRRSVGRSVTLTR